MKSTLDPSTAISVRSLTKRKFIICSYIGSLFSIRGPRDASALLDIERAFNKLEKVAVARRHEGKPPLVLIINSAHMIRDDHDGQDLLEMVQQRAEQWAASDLVITGMSLDSSKSWIQGCLSQHC